MNKDFSNKYFFEKDFLASNIHRIDVRETFKKALQNFESINVILKAMAQIELNIPLERPPDDEWDLMFYAAENDTLVFTVDPKLNTPEKLLTFAKLPQNQQQQILYRAYYVYRKFFSFNHMCCNFPLKLLPRD